MAVYCRYKSGVETFSVPMPAPTTSVADMKRLIMGTSRHGQGRTRGRGPRESVALSDARTGEEYTDDNALVPRNSTVVVRRVPGGSPAETITVAKSPPPPKTAQDDASVDSAGKPSSSSAQDDEDRAINAVIDAAQIRWEDHRPSHVWRCNGSRGAGAQERIMRPRPAGYVCHRCRVPGHLIQHCPTNGDPRFNFGRGASSTTVPPAPAAPASTIPDDDGIPTDLHCKMCKKVMADAVATSRCCFDSFCDACIRGHIVSKSKCVCGAQASADDLIPNQTLRVMIANTLATRAAATGVSSGSANNKSSAGSNEEATSHCPAASQGSRSQVTAAYSQHSDESASSTSKTKSAATPAAREPRTQQTTAESAQTMAHASYPEQFGYGGPFGPACYDPSFVGMAWAPDPYMYYGAPAYGGGYPVVPTPAAHHGGHGRKRTMGREDRRFEEPGFKRRRGSRSLVPV